MDSIHDIISQIIKHYGLNNNSFAKKIGLTNATTINNITGGRKSKPSFDLIERIFKTFPELNANWIFKKEGEMIIHSDLPPKKNQVSEPNEGYKSKVQQMQETIDLQLLRIETLNKLIESKEQTILSQRETIELLRSANVSNQGGNLPQTG